MRRSLIKTAATFFSQNSIPPSPILTARVINLWAFSARPRLRFFSYESPPPEKPEPASESSKLPEEVKDVSSEVLKGLMEKYFKENDEEVLPSIMEVILQRRLSKKHEESDDELVETMRMQPLDDVNDEEFEEGFDAMHETDEDIDDLYNAKEEYVVKKMQNDEYYSMDDKKWDEIVKEAMEEEIISDTRECEGILEDMLHWDKLLPDELKKKVETKFNELGDMCERGDLEPEEAYEMFKKFEDKMVMEYGNKMEAEGPPQLDETVVPDKKQHADDLPGEGPILRWQTRVVFAPGGEAWHPKNRKVKMSVTVKELGLSKYQFKRLRELVGKRYHPGRGELTITSERFEHREENRKDCLRTLFSLLEEAGKANKLAEDTRVSYIKGRLRANPAFMERLRAKSSRQGSNAVPA